jgi:hypothetical protein
MPITYYPGEWAKMRMHVIEQLQQPNMLHSVFGRQNLNSGALSVGVWCPKGWEVKRVSLAFDSASTKSYSISVVRGIGVATGRNDRIWVKCDATKAKEVIVPQGFYDGTTMAAALQTAMGSLDFATAAKPVSASYDSVDGTFTIAPSSGNVIVYVPGVGHTRFIGGILDRQTEYAPVGTVRTTSTLAPLIGFTATTSAAASATSDTSVGGIGTEMTILSAASSSTRNVTTTDALAMTIDDELLIESEFAAPGAGESSSSSSVSGDAGSGFVAYEVVYRILDA